MAILTEARELINDMVKSDYSFKERITGTTGKAKLSHRKVVFLKSFIELLRDSDIVWKYSKEYLFNPTLSMKQLSIKLSDEKTYGGEVTTRMINSHNHMSRVRLQSVFGDDMISNVRFKNIDIGLYENSLTSQYVKYLGDQIDLRGDLIIKMSPEKYKRELSEQEFNEFISIIAPYAKRQVEFIQTMLPDEYIGYFNFLCGNYGLNSVDKERLDRLKLIIMGKDE